MKRRRVIVGLVLLVVVGGAVALLRPRGPRPCRATFEQVHAGMTFEEVCATVGGPPGDYSGGTRFGLIDLNGPPITIWTAGDGELLVRFGYDGRVARAQVIEVSEIPRPPLIDRLRAWLGL